MPERQTDNSVNVKAATTKKPKATEMLKEAEKQILEAQAKLAASEAKLALTESKLKKALKKKKKNEIKLIPKPPGQPVKDYKLQAAMRLGEDKTRYNFLADSVRKAFAQSGLSPQRRITDFSSEELSMVYKLAEKNSPELAAYDRQWASKDLLMQYLKNLKLRRKRTAAAAANANGNGDGEGEQGAGEEEEDAEQEGEGGAEGEDSDEGDDDDEDEDEDEDDEDEDGDGEHGA
ncbi:hypothetical protein CALCODRAFT_486946 [Calocera cornea HHB12733]|uniref:Uncharacterized protein n=1 Tax=Calocera cornea HHB12733 TaxID=1353952 RepID=A0A165DFS8_9BASI|nr:hypothetical protein CALCODRAFT_486946 [Calocera cornea HHB12733]